MLNMKFSVALIAKNEEKTLLKLLIDYITHT